MNIADIVIIILVLGASLRGHELGFVRQLFSSGGFFVGLYLGALLQPHLVVYANNPLARLVITVGTTLGFGLLLFAVGEYLGILFKSKINKWHFKHVDNILGILTGAVSILLIMWLSAAILVNFPSPGLQNSIRNSAILTKLNTVLPSAPTIVASLGRVIDPNGFPQVFVGQQPGPPANFAQPSLGEMQAAVSKDRASIVKVQGQGCGGIVQGSGFVVGSNLIATNAHVVAGIKHPSVVDQNGSHSAQVIWFDPDLDFAVLRTNNLGGSALIFNTSRIARGTPTAVMGYPGGGGFIADPAAVLDEFTAVGKNIYDQNMTERDVYEVAAHIVHGNSGGPLVAKDGTVIGVVFAESTTYENVGYALTNKQIVPAISQASVQNKAVSTGSCAQ